MIATIIKLPKVGKIEKQKCFSPNSHKYKEVRTREYLLSEEIEAMLSVTKKSLSRYNHRNYTLILLIYRHGLRLSEVNWIILGYPSI
jgi:site-specific recombinase XerD